MIKTDAADRPRALSIIIATVVFMGLALRFLAAIQPSLHFPDEIGQYLEQAHRLVFGYGTVTWEYRYGMRSQFAPMLLAVPMGIGNAVAPGSTLYLILPKLVVAGATMSVCWAAYRFGRRISQTHAVVALCATALWFEQIFFAAHTLSETMATAAILPAAALMQDEAGRRNRLILAGMLFGLGALLRFHYAVPIAIIVLGSFRGEFRTRLAPVIIGGLITLSLGAAVDLSQGAVPFKWVFNNIYQNVIVNRSAAYGVSSPLSYLTWVQEYWGVGMIAILALAVPGSRPQRVLLLAAIANVLVHMLIGHKEYRFILLSTTIFTILAALGSVDVVNALSKHVTAQTRRALPAILIVGWGALSLILAFKEPMRQRWTAFGSSMGSLAEAGNDPDLCGVAVDLELYWATGSYTYLHRNVPIYVREAADPKNPRGRKTPSGSPAFNMVISAETSRSELPASYQITGCTPITTERHLTIYPQTARKICVFKRAGGCDGKGSEHSRIDEWLLEHDK